MNAYEHGWYWAFNEKETFSSIADLDEKLMVQLGIDWEEYIEWSNTVIDALGLEHKFNTGDRMQWFHWLNEMVKFKKK